MVAEWNQQYGEHHFANAPWDACRFFTAVYRWLPLLPYTETTLGWDWVPHEPRDPDGSGPLVPQRTEGDRIPVFAEYRGFILDGGGFDGSGGNAHLGGHKRLSPARREVLLEVDREDVLAQLPPGGVRDYLNVAGRVWSHAQQGAGCYVYYILDDQNLPAHNFLPGDPLLGASGVYAKQMAYLAQHRGSTLPGAAGAPNTAIRRSFTHVVILSDVPAIHQLSNAWLYDERWGRAPGDRGIYLLTILTHARAGAPGIGVTDQDYGGTSLAHEYMHMVIAPRRDGVTWDNGEHLVGNPGGNSLMGDAATQANSQRTTVVVGATTQVEIDLQGNPALER
jgi:hypothetical protein